MDELRFAHISDLHFQRKTARLVAGNAPRHTLLVRLEEALRHAKVSFVVVSGDLSDRGRAEELAMAGAYLRGRLQLGMTGLYHAGLECHDRLAVVPGNHDHWNGWWWPWAYSRSILGTYFPATPWVRCWSAGGLTLQLLGIDSSSGNRGLHRIALCQGGRISEQEWQELETKVASLPNPSENSGIVRALVLHHSLQYGGGLSRWRPPQAAPLHSKSRRRLLEFAEKHKVLALLTGHTHDFWWPKDPTAQHLHELRSATTLCGPPQAGKQGFLLHRIQFDDRLRRPVTWSVQKIGWGGAGFLPNCRDHYRFQPV